MQLSLLPKQTSPITDYMYNTYQSAMSTLKIHKIKYKDVKSRIYILKKKNIFDKNAPK